MKIQVTQKHIDLGTRCSCWNCPVAKAILDFNPKFISVAVRTRSISVGVSLTGFTPPIVREFIHKYDSSQPVEPFEFELKLEESDGYG